jgi:uncharacterized protein (DUF433 family)
MSQLERKVLDASANSGQPIVRSTCVLVRLILGYLAYGETAQSILRDFPSISEEDVHAVIAFAASAPKDELPQIGPFQRARMA